MLKEIKIEKFTAFDDLDVVLSEGINVLIGANGTGKTHLLKLLYGSMRQADSRVEKNMDQTLQGLFMRPDQELIAVKYFSARLTNGPEKNARQYAFLQANKENPKFYETRKNIRMRAII